jgi:hypothetical protein
MNIDLTHRNGDTLLKKQCQSEINYRKLIKIDAREMSSCGKEFRKNSDRRNGRTANLARSVATKHREYLNSWSDAHKNVASLRDIGSKTPTG